MGVTRTTGRHVHTRTRVAGNGGVDHLTAGGEAHAAVPVIKNGGVHHRGHTGQIDSAGLVLHRRTVAGRIVKDDALVDKRRFAIHTLYRSIHVNGTTLRGIVADQEAAFDAKNAALAVVAINVNTAAFSGVTGAGCLTVTNGKTVDYGRVRIVVARSLRRIQIYAQHVGGIVRAGPVGRENQVNTAHRVVLLDVAREHGAVLQLIGFAQRDALAQPALRAGKAAVELHARLHRKALLGRHVKIAAGQRIKALHPNLVAGHSLIQGFGKRRRIVPRQAVAGTLSLRTDIIGFALRRCRSGQEEGQKHHRKS